MSRALFCAAALAAAGTAAGMSTDSAIRIDGATSTYRDSTGRTRLFHGINYVNKGGDYIPEVTPEIADQLKTLGFNVVRLGVMLPGVFPTDSTPNAAYLDSIEAIVGMLWERGVHSVLDLHQDVLSPKICGEGTPDWMWNVSTLGALPFPEPMAFTGVSKADPATGAYSPPVNCTPRGILKTIGWSGYYMTDASGKAFEQMYAGTSVLGQMVEKYWSVVAQRFKGNPGVLFYELLNEPWFGDHVSDPLLLIKGGEAEKRKVGPFMQRLADAVKAVDPDTPVLYAPAELNNRLMRHVGFEAGFLAGNPMAFHVYCVTGTDGDGPTTPFTQALCHLNDNLQIDNRRADLKRLSTAGFITEFGAVSDSPTGLAEVKYVVDHFDGSKKYKDMPLSWIYWLGIPPQEDYQRELSRAYPHAVGGDIASMAFDTVSSRFDLSYNPTAGTTEIYTPPLHYPNGYNVVATPSDACTWRVSPTDPNILEITATGTAQITLTITRK